MSSPGAPTPSSARPAGRHRSSPPPVSAIAGAALARRADEGVGAPGAGHLGWYSRGYLPHLDEAGRVQAVTFRLADSLPRVLLESWEDELVRLPVARVGTERLRRIAQALDRGLGACWLRHNEIAEIAEHSLLHAGGGQYHLLSWCNMPNHIHVLIEPIEGWPLYRIVQAWKSVTSRAALRILDRPGPFWARDYFDRFIRNDEHLERASAYIHQNPVTAGLAASPEAWRWSSAWHVARAEPALPVGGS